MVDVLIRKIEVGIANRVVRMENGGNRLQVKGARVKQADARQTAGRDGMLNALLYNLPENGALNIMIQGIFSITAACDAAIPILFVKPASGGPRVAPRFEYLHGFIRAALAQCFKDAFKVDGSCSSRFKCKHSGNTLKHESLHI